MAMGEQRSYTDPEGWEEKEREVLVSFRVGRRH